MAHELVTINGAPHWTARLIDLFVDTLAFMRRIRIKLRTHERPWLMTIVFVILLGLGNAFDAVLIWVLGLGVGSDSLRLGRDLQDAGELDEALPIIVTAAEK